LRRDIDAFVRRAFCQRAREYVEFSTGPGAGYAHAADALVVHFLGTTHPEMTDLLDLGCGADGVFEGRRLRSYIGVDVSTRLLRGHALRGLANVKLLDCDMRRLCYKPLNYNAVTSVLSLHYIEKPGVLVHRMARRGAVFCFVLPNPEFDRQRAVIRDGSVVELCLEGFMFRYYHLSVERVVSWFRGSEACGVRFSSTVEGDAQPAYFAVEGKW